MMENIRELLLLFMIGWIWLLRKKVAERTIAMERELQERLQAEKEKKEFYAFSQQVKAAFDFNPVAFSTDDINNLLI